MDIDDILDMIDNNEESSSDDNDEGRDTLVTTLRSNKRPKSVASLEELSLKSIADNIKYWMTHVPPNANEALYIISPFDVLRGSDVKSVIKILVDKKMYRHEYFHLFLHYKLTAMDFSVLPKHVALTDNVMKCMFKRCKRVKELTIPNVKLSLKTLNNIPVRYPDLECLRVLREVCQDEFLDLLATHCSKLKLLAIENCANIPDAMFDRLKECTSLCFLSLHHAEYMTCNTFQRITAQLPSLAHLSLIGCKINFAALNKCNVGYPQVRCLDLSLSSITDSGLLKITSRMMNLSELQLSRCQNLTTLAFKHISNLQSLLKLSLGYFTRDYEFDSHVEMCLLRVGAKLRYLDLSGMPRVQPQTIALCCLELRSLHMNHCVDPNVDWIRLTNENQAPSPNVPPTNRLSSFLSQCQRVEELSISCMHLRDDDVAKIFSSSSSLKKLKFLPWSHDALVPLSEQFFLDFFGNFNFENLEELDISGNDGVTKKVVLRVLQRYSNLKILSVSGCNLVKQELSAIRDIVRQAQLDVVLK